jgi:molybdopterin-guanine dinucleotide biosynthesis protein A
MSDAAGSAAPSDPPPRDRVPIGAILAGGGSTRYGAPKALARVRGVRIVDRVVAALRAVTPDLLLSTNDPGLFHGLGIAACADERPDAGPLGGIHALLLRARDAGRPGILAVAVDMPFPCVPLLERLRTEAFGASRPDEDAGSGAPDVVVPESGGRRGIEPLFAAYRTSCLPAIEAALDAGDRRMIGFHERVRVRRIPQAQVAALCDPEMAFLNVNTPAERDRAESLAAERSGVGRETGELP